MVEDFRAQVFRIGKNRDGLEAIRAHAIILLEEFILVYYVYNVYYGKETSMRSDLQLTELDAVVLSAMVSRKTSHNHDCVRKRDSYKSELQ